MARFSRTYRTAGALAAAAAVVVTAPEATALPEKVNWVLMEVRARTAVDGFEYEFTARHRPDADMPAAVLRGIARPGVAIRVTTSEFDSFPHSPTAPWHVDVTATGPAAVDHRVFGEPRIAYGSSLAATGSVRDPAAPLAAGEPVYLLLAVPTGRFLTWPSLAVTPAGAFDVAMVAQGGDAGYARARGPETEGVSAGVNDVGPVSVAATVALRKGAVAAVAISNCAAGRCTWTSRASDGETGSWTGTGKPTANGRSVGYTGGGAVAGPPGTWRWTADAAAYDGKMIAAYVPLGDYWSAFRGPEG